MPKLSKPGDVSRECFFRDRCKDFRNRHDQLPQTVPGRHGFAALRRFFIQSNSIFASRHSQKSAIVQMLQGSRCRLGVTAPGIDHPCVAEMRLQFSRMHYAELPNSLENLLLQLRHASDIPRMQKLPDHAGKKTVRVENVL